MEVDQVHTPAAAGAARKLRVVEDSGYHTPGSSELSGALDASSGARVRYRRVPDSLPRRRFMRTRSHAHSGEQYPTVSCTSPAPSGSGVTLLREQYEPFPESPPRRRPLKRSLEEVEERAWCLETTPTAVITGDLQKLAVTDESTPYLEAAVAREEHSRRELATSDYFSLSSIAESSRPLSYPTTPVKSSRCKIAKLSPRCEKRSCNKYCSPTKATKENCHPRRSVKKLSFIRSLKEDTKSGPRPVRPLVIPDKKIDIITLLFPKYYSVLSTILEFLDGEALYNFSQVSQSWELICSSFPKANCIREQYVEFINVTKENHNNRNSGKKTERTCSDDAKVPSVLLRDIHNLINGRQKQPTPIRSPPRTPRSTKFRNFTKSASLDTRLQLSCVRCGLPAKVTEERGGEQWAQCRSDSCAFIFCRFCKCARHPGNACFQYSLEAGSPAKRCKRSNSITGTTKSKKILRRLLV